MESRDPSEGLNRLWGASMELWEAMVVVALIPVLLGLALLAIMILLLVLARRVRNLQQIVTALDRRTRHVQGRRARSRVRAVVQAAEAIEHLSTRIGFHNGIASGNGVRASPLRPYVAACRSFVEQTRHEGRSQDSVDAVVRLVLQQCLREAPWRTFQLRCLLTHEETARWLNRSAADQCPQNRQVSILR